MAKRMARGAGPLVRLTSGHGTVAVFGLSSTMLGQIQRGEPVQLGRRIVLFDLPLASAVSAPEVLNDRRSIRALTARPAADSASRLAFSDIRKAVDWHGHVTEETDNPDGGDVLVIKKIVTNQVAIRSACEIDDDTAAAISEIRQDAKGVDSGPTTSGVGVFCNMFARSG
jgi:hypothetical protein